MEQRVEAFIGAESEGGRPERGTRVCDGIRTNVVQKRRVEAFMEIEDDIYTCSVTSWSFLKGTEPFLRPKVPFIMTQNTLCTPLQMINVNQCGFTAE